jgi:hypothetical protein
MENNFQNTQFIKTANYICVQNQGQIVPEDLMLIGSSSKRDAVGKIGFFGSGWKYALAVLMKNGAKPIIFSGKEEIDIDTEMVEHRGNIAEVITINGQRTSLTTGMGPKWLMWQAFREIFSNAIDEGGHHIYGSNNPYGTEDITRVYIPNVPGIKEVMDAFDTYFTFQLTPSFTDQYGSKLFIWENEQKNTFHFRKGIRCYENLHQKSNYSIDFAEISINEQRLSDSWTVRARSKDFFNNVNDAKIARWMFLNVEDGHMASKLNDTLRNVILEMQEEGYKFATVGIKRIFGDLLLGATGVIAINDDLYKACMNEKLLKDSKFGNGEFAFISSNMHDLETAVEYHLEKCIPEVQVNIGKMEGAVHVKNEGGICKIHLNVSKIDDLNDDYGKATSAVIAAYILNNMDTKDGIRNIAELLRNVPGQDTDYVMVPREKWEAMQKLFNS